MVSVRPGRSPGAAAYRSGLTWLSFDNIPNAKGYEMSGKVENRNRAVLDAAVALAAERGYRNMTRAEIAERAGVATGSVNNAYGTMEALRDAAMSAAVDRGIVAVVAQGIADRHPAALAAPQDLKDSALQSLAA